MGLLVGSWHLLKLVDRTEDEARADAAFAILKPEESGGDAGIVSALTDLDVALLEEGKVRKESTPPKM
jgi:hypothetical protein